MTLLDGALADEARRAVDALSRALLDSPASDASDASLARGGAGIGLAHAYLLRLFPERPHGERAQRELEQVARAATHAPWLMTGLAGVGWVLEHLGKDAPDPDDALARVERALLVRLDDVAPLPFELMHGVAGLTVFGAERAPRPQARTLLARIAARLHAAATRDDQGAHWRSKAQPGADTPAAQIENFGLAHGVPGAVLALATLVRSDVGGEAVRELLADGCRWLLARRLPRESDGWFPAASTSATTPARTAWCYGDPGVAWALFAAGSALGDAAVTRTSIDVALHASRRPELRTGVRDAGFCHGAAGLAHVFHRMAAHSGEAALADAAREWLARALRMRVAGAPLGGFRAWTGERGRSWANDASLLTGASGIALVLASAIDPQLLEWDAPLMLAQGLSP